MFVIKHLSESARLTDNWKHIIPQCSMLLTSRFMLMTHLRALITSKRGCWKPNTGNVSDLALMIENGNQIFYFSSHWKGKRSSYSSIAIEDNQSRCSMVKAQLLPDGVNFPSRHNTVTVLPFLPFMATFVRAQTCKTNKHSRSGNVIMW